jgi:TatD DNase family protein
MFIDTHCHLTDRYTDGADTIIARANDAGVGALICACAEPDDFDAALDLCTAHKNVFCTIGIHPERAGINPEFADLLKNKFVLGVGEIGLDYHYEPIDKPAQHDLFERQIEMAVTAALPVAIHSRDAADDTLAVLKNHPGVRGVMHSFAYDYEFARKLMDSHDFYFSANGILTFKNGQNLRDAFEKIPLDRIVIETDAPYLAPVPYRGKQCEPFMVVETAKMLANVKNISIDELEKILAQNTKKLYPGMEIKE